MLDLKIIDHKRDACGSGGTSGDTYSPSEVLEHEFGHSANKINNPEKYKKDVSSPYVIKIINGIPVILYENKEEQQNIEKIDNRNGKTRNTDDGEKVEVNDVLSTDPVKQ